ncbi:DNA/RNA polymerase [Saitoella complicata NRRL Y-17804]|nr:DNA/RNA polymerase [Saitoella complicata NRRL Y-17804]ODQ51250.1 DNA/RNA polymerase [Saitoella complicata NRRL Y-17804]
MGFARERNAAQSDGNAVPLPVTDAEPTVPSKSDVDGLESLRHRLAGPSTTKAGLDSSDQERINRIIYEASKGSKFFENEKRKDAELTAKIRRVQAKLKELEGHDLRGEVRRADELLAKLEQSRDLSQCIVHVDCDAFYASVEELDRPELKDIPMGVGMGVLTTANYHARKFGVRSAMPVYIAKKLCPQLTVVPCDFTKYTRKSKEVQSVIEKYDPNFRAASLDEAYMNITEWCRERGVEPEDAVQDMRREVFEVSRLTVSAGIAPNSRLAKVCSDRNKPNGQFRILSTKDACLDFARELPCRKVSGVGRVFERELEAVGVKTCGDIFEKRSILRQVFGEKAFEFLMEMHLGLGSTEVRPAESYERKSIGTESTFSTIFKPDELRAKLRQISEDLEGDCERTQLSGRTLHLKIKLDTYEVYTRQVAMGKYIWQADELYKHGLPLLEREIHQAGGNLRLRLMGLRLTQLGGRGESDKVDVNKFFGVKRSNSDSITATKRIRTGESPSIDSGDFSFEDGVEDDLGPPQLEELPKEEKVEEDKCPCPICGLLVPADDRKLNEHIDLCLSRETIKEAARGDQEGRVEVPNIMVKKENVQPFGAGKANTVGRTAMNGNGKGGGLNGWLKKDKTM